VVRGYATPHRRGPAANPPGGNGWGVAPVSDRPVHRSRGSDRIGMPASNILTGFEIQALPLLFARRRVYRQLIGSWSNATARSLKRKSGGTQANAASARHPRKGRKGRCGRTGRRGVSATKPLPPGGEGLDLEHVRPVNRQGFGPSPSGMRQPWQEDRRRAKTAERGAERCQFYSTPTRQLAAPRPTCHGRKRPWTER
jgi:hypothetical protein